MLINQVAHIEATSSTTYFDWSFGNLLHIKYPPNSFHICVNNSRILSAEKLIEINARLNP